MRPALLVFYGSCPGHEPCAVSVPSGCFIAGRRQCSEICSECCYFATAVYQVEVLITPLAG